MDFTGRHVDSAHPTRAIAPSRGRAGWQPSTPKGGLYPRTIGENAVILGAGIAGLLAAAALCAFYNSVIAVERDALLDRPAPRRGVPQGRHLHMLLSRGAPVMAELFPGLLDKLTAAGAVVFDDGDLSQLYARIGRYELKRSGALADPAALAVHLASRPFPEFQLRRRVAALGNVRILDRHDVVEPVTADAAVVGVRIINRNNGLYNTLAADLVIDAMGRAARTPTFLAELGYGHPPAKRSEVSVAYSSQPLSIPQGCIAERLALFNHGINKHRGLPMACEHDTWMLAIGHSAKAGRPPANFTEMLALAEQSLPASIMAGLGKAQPLGRTAIMRNATAVWRRFDQMPRFPSGLLVIGDALRSLDPTYGQGMTMAALQAMTLRNCLQSGATDLAPRFFSATARQIGPTWVANQVRDRMLSPTSQPHSLRQRVMGWTAQAALNAAGNDIIVTERFLRVMNLIDSPARLQDLRLLPRILAINARSHRISKRPNLIQFRHSVLTRSRKEARHAYH
ncbi:MAG: FAD-dependent monooxygenase [Mycobacteriaceae bacterium]|nr:FAD-dependent monooxygenase [Mycobacteriaceae bacterium]